ncbi:gamma-tubulin complex component 5 [Lycorma delicatula]|uniref:gamma-tubulin complex component 5 n=1 Tax=Lycorma delicatula TaxID=130591 RepID=UPI003F512DB0
MDNIKSLLVRRCERELGQLLSLKDQNFVVAMAVYEFKRKQLIKPDLRKLINHLTNFQEDDTEFKQCENFALSQILHHTYLSVNRHEVQRSIKGLINKFSVHGFVEKANKLEILVDKFINSRQFKGHEEVDVEWSILLLLMNLSDNPTSMVLQEDITPLPCLTLPEEERKEGDIEIKEPDVNWTEYLKEGLENFELPNDEEDSSTWSGLESDDETSEIVSQSVNVSPHPVKRSLLSEFSFTFSNEKVTGLDDHQSSMEKDIECERDKMMRFCEEKLKSESWLKENIQYNWWNDPAFRMEPDSTNPSARFAIIWEEHKHKQTQGLIPLGGTLLISEYKLIREVLWILQVPADTFIFKITNSGEVITKENISIPSLTPESLALYLKTNVCCYAEMVYHLINFVEDLEGAEHEMKKPPYTYQSYANALHELLLSFFSTVCKIEQTVEKQENTCTLVSVVEELRPSFVKLSYIYSLHKAVAYDWRRSEGWFSSVRLLAIFYEDVYTSWKDEFVEVALELFVKSFKVYLQIIDIWLSEGKLEDWRDEFIIKRYEGDLKVVAYNAFLKEIKKTRIINIFQAVEKAGADLEHIRRLGEISALTTKIENKGCLYNEFLEHLGYDLYEYTSFKLNEDFTTCDSSEVNEYDIGSNCDELLKSSSEKQNKSESHPQPQSLPSLSLQAKEFDSAWYELTTKHLFSSPWLAMSFRKCTEFEKRPSVLHKRKDEFRNIIEKDYVVNMGTLPLHHLIERNVMRLVAERQRIASKIMVETLLKKCKLQQHLSLLGNVYVLEASYIIQRFYSRLFKPMPDSLERAEYSMNVLLEECVECIASQEIANDNKFSVKIVDHQNTASSNIIDFINIDYKVDLPLSLIITKESLEIYNSVFKFLLKIEWALASLHQLRFSDIKDTESNHLRLRVLYKLRIFLIHCVSILHSYFVTFTPKELRIKLDSALSQASSFDDIISAHNRYLSQLKSHCLLDSGNASIMKAILKLLFTCGSLNSYWTKEAESSLTSEELTNLEEDYTRAHVVLHFVLKHSVGQHSNSSLRFLSADIERCLPVSAVSYAGQGDQASFENKDC